MPAAQEATVKRFLLTLAAVLLAGATAATLALAPPQAPGAVPASEPFLFIQLTDPQLGAITSDADFIQETANFEFAIATVNRLRPAFVIVTGDLVNKVGDPAQLAEYQRIAAKVDPAIPLYHLPGNHDVGNTPTKETQAAYTKLFGPDRYVIRRGGFVGIVLNSNIIVAPKEVADEVAAQEQWLHKELDQARRSGARHIVIFQHHPWFLKDPAEADSYFNIATEVRAKYLDLLKGAGVRAVIAGHLHYSALARDGDLEMITTGPISRPSGGDKSGIRVFTVTDSGITHQYYDFGALPNRLKLPK